jgi:hypothetical protein
MLEVLVREVTEGTLGTATKASGVKARLRRRGTRDTHTETIAHTSKSSLMVQSGDIDEIPTLRAVTVDAVAAA